MGQPPVTFAIFPIRFGITILLGHSVYDVLYVQIYILLFNIVLKKVTASCLSLCMLRSLKLPNVFYGARLPRGQCASVCDRGS
jgi:hypothetical protein